MGLLIVFSVIVVVALIVILVFASRFHRRNISAPVLDVQAVVHAMRIDDTIIMAGDIMIPD